MIGTYLNMAAKNLVGKKLRSWLTLIGIIIGIFAVISLITLGNGLKNAVGGQFDMLAANRIMIADSGNMLLPSGSGSLVDDDRDAIEDMKEIDYATSVVSNSAFIGYGDEKSFGSFRGVYTVNLEKSFSEIDLELSSGRMIDKSDKYSVVIGHDLANEGFDKKIHVGNQLTIKGQRFKVVGIFEKIGDTMEDNMVFMPIDTAQDLLGYDDHVTAISATVKAGYDIDKTMDEVEELLNKRHGKDDVEVTNPKQIQENINEVLGIVQYVFVGIALISLIVGGIGIMNSMYTSVLERTRDIGIMKAIGASNGDILLIFLIESGFIGLVGGIIGIGLGVGLAKLVDFAVSEMGYSVLKIEISVGLLVFGLAFSMLVGMLSGALPAYRASKLKPVDALRYE
ncbi:MAG: ABC transporter permease [Candidatus Aenigmarchaeota archaeon]|nr:ABC transporter permease [Candidatus Aenigmarchaeota archaeon]